jgi:hypothetical protein
MNKSTNLTIPALLRFQSEKGKKGEEHEGKLRRANTAKWQRPRSDRLALHN